MPVRDVDYFLKQLDRCRGRELSATLVRRVPWTALHASADFLFVSGKPNRYNLAGTGCIYFAADDLTAQWEYEDGLGGSLALLQPVVVFRAKVRLKKRPALDLLDHDTRRTLGLTTADLFVDWVKNPPVATQCLGEAVSRSRAFAAIRYPSRATRRRHHRGVNVVVFRNCVAAPDSVEILGPSGTLQRWP